MLYRVLKTLAGTAKRGDIVALPHLQPPQLAKLEAVGAISPVAAPPLSELPDFADRVALLAAHDIHDVEALVEADAAALAAALDIPVDTLCRWTDEARLWLFI